MLQQLAFFVVGVACGVSVAAFFHQVAFGCAVCGEEPHYCAACVDDSLTRAGDRIDGALDRVEIELDQLESLDQQLANQTPLEPGR